jgi:low-affinity inorganic phosphate transporter
LDDTAKKIQKLPSLTPSDQEYLKKLRSDINKPIEYAPFWTIVAIALALGLGTMVGWKRVVKTVGEGIGKKEMTYAQGAAAQLTTAIAVGLASFVGLPVSTTQVLSSSVAGAVVSGGIQMSTVKKIFLTWIVTLPSTMLLAGGLFYLSTLFLVN